MERKSRISRTSVSSLRQQYVLPIDGTKGKWDRTGNAVVYFTNTTVNIQTNWRFWYQFVPNPKVQHSAKGLSLLIGGHLCHLV